MSDQMLEELKTKLDKGSAESKAEAFIAILKKYGDQPEIKNLVTKKLIKLRSYKAFSEIIYSDVANILPKDNIYLERIKSKDYRIRIDLLGRDFIESLPKHTAQEKLLNLINHDPDWRVRYVAFRMLAVFYTYFDDEGLADIIFDIAKHNFAESGSVELKEGEGTIWVMEAFAALAKLPFSKKLFNFVSEELSRTPCRFDPYLIFDPIAAHPEEFKVIISLVKNIISGYLQPKQGFWRKKNKQHALKNKTHFVSGYEYNDVDRLCSGLLKAYKLDTEIISYLHGITVKINNPKSDFLHSDFFVTLVHSPDKISDFCKKLLKEYIKNQKNNLFIRYYAIENLRKFYSSHDNAEPKDLLQQVLHFVRDTPNDFKEDIVVMFYDTTL